MRAAYQKWQASPGAGIFGGFQPRADFGRDGCSLHGIRRDPYEPWSVRYTHHERRYKGGHVIVLKTQPLDRGLSAHCSTRPPFHPSLLHWARLEERPTSPSPFFRSSGTGGCTRRLWPLGLREPLPLWPKLTGISSSLPRGCTTSATYPSCTRPRFIPFTVPGTSNRWTHRRVLTTRTGRPIDPQNINRSFFRITDAAGLCRIRLHDARHGCATLLTAAGVAPRGRDGDPRPRPDQQHDGRLHARAVRHTARGHQPHGPPAQAPHRPGVNARIHVTPERRTPRTVPSAGAFALFKTRAPCRIRTDDLRFTRAAL